MELDEQKETEKFIWRKIYDYQNDHFGYRPKLLNIPKDMWNRLNRPLGGAKKFDGIPVHVFESGAFDLIELLKQI